MIEDLETERLKLRAWRESDLDAFAEFSSDAELTRFTSGPANRDDTWRRIATFLGHWQIRGFGPWAIEDKADGAFVGYSGLWFPSGWTERELIWGLRRRYHGFGIATEAARRARAFARDTLGWTTLVSYIVPDNRASRRVAERLDAVQSGTTTLRGTAVEIWRHPMTAG